MAVATTAVTTAVTVVTTAGRRLVATPIRSSPTPRRAKLRRGAVPSLK
jgi:hypothetical protein